MGAVTIIIIHFLSSITKIMKIYDSVLKIRMCNNTLSCQVVANNFFDLFSRFLPLFSSKPIPAVKPMSEYHSLNVE
jgi:hypothetical protein